MTKVKLCLVLSGLYSFLNCWNSFINSSSVSTITLNINGTFATHFYFLIPIVLQPNLLYILDISNSESCWTKPSKFEISKVYDIRLQHAWLIMWIFCYRNSVHKLKLQKKTISWILSIIYTCKGYHCEWAWKTRFKWWVS